MRFNTFIFGGCFKLSSVFDKLLCGFCCIIDDFYCVFGCSRSRRLPGHCLLLRCYEWCLMRCYVVARTFLWLFIF